jgi:hypothetical protein
MLLQTLVAMSAKRVQSLIVIDGWLAALFSVLKMCVSQISFLKIDILILQIRPDAEGVDVPGKRGNVLAEAQVRECFLAPSAKVS